MYRLIIAILAGFWSVVGFSECTDKQNEADVDIKIDRLAKSIKAGGSHGFMDEIVISMPLDTMGMSLNELYLTEGEVESYWVPLAYTTEDDFAKVSIIGYKHAIKNFEISAIYQKEACTRRIQFLIFGK